jgi:periplasmic divalent cation tolerance protein
MPDDFCIIFTTAGSQEEADQLAEMLVARRLAACVQIANIASCYRWKGKMIKEPEFLLLIKTAADLYAEVEAAILENHSYEVPEIVQLPITQGLDRYLEWIGQNTITPSDEIN